MAHIFLGEMHFEIGDFPKSKNQGYDLFENNQLLSSFVDWEKASLARAKVMNSERDVELESLYAYSWNN